MIKRKLNLLQRNNNSPEDYQWSSQSYTLEHITDDFKLPCVVKCNADSCSTEWTNFRFDLTQPILLHSVHHSRKLRVKCMKKDDDTGKFVELEHTNVIPEQYEGWFQILKDPDEETKPEQSVEAVLQSSADQFLLANSVEGLNVVTETDGSKFCEKKGINNGEILRVKCTYGADLRKTDVNSNEFDEISHDAERPVKYVLCSDEKDEEVLLPLSLRGQFYKIYDSEEKGHGLIEAQDLIDQQDLFPFLVRHVVGERPTLMSAYSRVMKCDDVIEEQTILASSLNVDSMSLFELQMNSPIKFKMALNEAQIKMMETYSDALQLCNTTGDNYMGGIKVAFKFKPEVKNDISIDKKGSDLSDDDPACDTSSELVEEDANSEFSFEWTPETIKPKRTVSQKKDRNDDKGQTNGSQTKIPKFFNSCINNPKSSSKDNVSSWNEEPDIV